MALKQRVVVVGIGSIGRRHARLLGGRSDLEVEWCEPNQEFVADAVREMPAPGCIHRDFNAMIATAPAMVVLATPHPLHAGQSIKALEAGAHVLCEKPMADGPGAARRMLAAATASGRVLSIGFQLHFHPGLRRLKELIVSGALGTIAHLHCRVGSYVTLANSRTRYQHSLEGALMFDYAHQSDLLYWLLRSVPLGVYAAGAHLDSPELHSNPNVLSLNFDYARPLLGTIHLNYLQAPERHEYEVVGDQGWAVLDLASSSLTIGRRDDSRKWVESFEVARDSLYVAEHQAFLDAVNGTAAPASPPDEALVSVLMTAAALSSWKSRQRVILEAV
jgi:UDP-N-acetylglucosamine 3-dehydrogenase